MVPEAGAALALAQALIARASVTPQDAGCQALLAERLGGAGFRCEAMPFGAVRNLWARRGCNAPVFCFLGHTDVVPPGPRTDWTTDPFSPTVRDGRLYGRGAADMKSSIAAFVVAAETFVRERPAHRGSIALLLTSDEEGPALDGTARVVANLARRGERLDWCLVGEPSSTERLGDTIRIGRRGSLSARLTVRGVEGHVAYPEKVRNPVHALAPALAELAAMRWDEGTAEFPPTSFQVSSLHAGSGAENVVPALASLACNFRFSPASTEACLCERFEAVLRRHGLDYEVQWTLGARPFLSARGALLAAVRSAVRSHTGSEPTESTGGGTSDGRFVIEICPEVVELGPVNASIHKRDEHIELEALECLPRIYLDVLRSLLG